MLFSSVEFIFRFLPIFMILYMIVPKKYQNLVLFLGSIIFYGVGEPYYVLLLIFSVLVNYGFSRLLFDRPSVSAKQNRAGQKGILAAAIVFDFSFLFVFKYWDFLAESINHAVKKDFMPLLSLVLPLGISFYTFQIVAYLVDCYRGKISKNTGFLSFAAYVCMFPQLIAGPIVKYEEVAAEMQERRITAKKIESGLKLFCIGLGYKVLLANQIGTLWNTLMTAGARNLSVPAAWLGAFAYSFQIYFDFWGYSLMAKGLGKMLGFKIPRNFNHPYISKSISEFWRRWHITLGRWFKEYLYIPLGGNRKGFARTVLHLCIVWTLTGVWHGANWNFALWGFVFFVLLAIEKSGFGKWLEQTKVLGHLYVIAIIPVTWMIFAIEDFDVLLCYLQNMIGIHTTSAMVGMEQVVRCLKEYWVLFILCILFATPYPMRAYQKVKNKWYVVVLIVAVFWYAVYEIMMGNNNPFLYFRF